MNQKYVIFEDDELPFLEQLYNKISIYDPYTREIVYCKNGVH